MLKGITPNPQESSVKHIEKSFVVEVPVRMAYNQWTQFEDFPLFMDGVEEVKQLDDTRLLWRVSVAGVEKQWESEITEQVPDELIAWRGIAGAGNFGQVTFEALGRDSTRIHLQLGYEPEGPLEEAGAAMGIVSRQVDKTIEDFKSFIEGRGRETGAWRGEVHVGRPPGS